MCGGNLTMEDVQTVCECEYCGSKQTVPCIDDDKILKLYERANRLRMANEFDKAYGVYESIVAERDTEAEAYWGMILCKFGIEYVDDPATGNKIPTCHRSSFESIMEDSDFELVMENADGISRSVYREQAKQIEEIRKGIIEVSGKEQPYDIFICYKETDESGDRTIDSVIAQDVYEALTDKGYRVFFSRISLEDKLGTEYEPYIFAALNSAKVMLAFGTTYDYYNAVWVKNEWSRFLKLMAKDKSKFLIPCFKDIDAYDMPKEFARLQSQDMGKVGAMQDLLRGIEKIIGVKQIEINVNHASTNIESSNLVNRGMIALADEEFSEAADYFERALDIDYSNAKAYLGKFLALNKLTSLQDIIDADIDVELEKDVLRAEKFADPELKAEIKQVVEAKQQKKLAEERARAQHIEYFENMKKEIFLELLFDIDKKEGIIKYYSEKLQSEDKLNKKELQEIIDKSEIVNKYGTILRDCQGHAIAEIKAANTSNKYSEKTEETTLSDLVKYDYVEVSGGEARFSSKCMDRAKKEYETYLNKKMEHENAVAKMEAQLMEELFAVQQSIMENETEKKNKLKSEIKIKIQTIYEEKSRLMEQINDLENEKNSLSLFKVKEKNALSERIKELEARIKSLPTEQDIDQEYQPQFDLIEREARKEMRTAKETVKSKYRIF